MKRAMNSRESDYNEYLTANKPYYNTDLNSYSKYVKHYNGYMSVILCIIGTLANIVNIVIFTHKGMITSMNIIFTALATADMLRVLTYIPIAYIYDNSVQLYSEVGFSKSLAYIAIACIKFMTVPELTSVWLTVLLSVWRFIAIYCPLSAGRLLTMKRTWYAVTAVFCICVCISTPMFLITSVKELEGNNVTLYTIDFSDFIMKTGFVGQLSYWFSAIFMEIVPCILVCIFTLALTIVLHQAKAHRQNMTHCTENDAEWRRINKMLLTILLLFVFTELPNGILLVCGEILGPDFVSNVYHKLVDTLHILDLLNHSMNCIVYYTMITKYRETFHSIFNCHMCKNVKHPIWLGKSSQRYHLENTSSAHYVESTLPLPNVESTSSAHYVESTLPLPNVKSTLPLPNVKSTLPLPNVKSILYVHNADLITDA